MDSLGPALRTCLGLAAGAAALLLLAGCGGAVRAESAAAVVSITERDFGIVATPRNVAAGTVLLRVSNHGPDRHELIAVRLKGGGLPLRTDGMTIDEEALTRATIGVLEPGATGTVRELRVHLRPGRYMLFCNMSGHYMGGMHTVIVVT